MSRYKITAPVERYEGEIAGARFVDGVATVEDGSPALAYCSRRGYKVEPLEGEAPEGEPDEDAGSAPSRPNVNASKAEWVAWAVHSGAEEADAEGQTKAELIEQYGN